MSARLAVLFLLLLTLGWGRPAIAQDNPDQVRSATEVRSPRGALRRAMALPGWGQIYNGHYLKLPLLYAGIGVFVAAAITNQQDYALYRNAYQYKAWEDAISEGQENPAQRFQSDYEEIAAVFGTSIRASALETQRDNYRRNRDLSYLGIGALWALGVLDAYVSAHLSDFDVGENLTISVVPTLSPASYYGVQGAPIVAPGFRASLSW